MQDCLRPTWVCKTILSGSNLREPSLQEPDFTLSLLLNELVTIACMICSVLQCVYGEKTD